MDGPDQYIAVGLSILHKDQQQLEGGLHHGPVIGGNQRVEPLHRRLMLHHAVHPVHIEHDLPHQMT